VGQKPKVANIPFSPQVAAKLTHRSGLANNPQQTSELSHMEATQESIPLIYEQMWGLSGYQLSNVADTVQSMFDFHRRHKSPIFL